MAGVALVGYLHKVVLRAQHPDKRTNSFMTSICFALTLPKNSGSRLHSVNIAYLQLFRRFTFSEEINPQTFFI